MLTIVWRSYHFLGENEKKKKWMFEYMNQLCLILGTFNIKFWFPRNRQGQEFLLFCYLFLNLFFIDS